MFSVSRRCRLKSNKPAALGNKSPIDATSPAESFDVLIERAALLFAVGVTDEPNEEKALELYKQAIDRIIEAASSPFFGGTKTTVSQEGLDVVRELVFERVGDELKKRGYKI